MLLLFSLQLMGCMDLTNENKPDPTEQFNISFDKANQIAITFLNNNEKKPDEYDIFIIASEKKQYLVTITEKNKPFVEIYNIYIDGESGKITPKK